MNRRMKQQLRYRRDLALVTNCVGIAELRHWTQNGGQRPCLNLDRFKEGRVLDLLFCYSEHWAFK